MYASSFRLKLGGLAGTCTPPTTVRLCPSQTLPVAITGGNNGQSNQTINQRIFGNTSPPNSGYSGGFDWGYWTGGTVNAFGWVTWDAGSWSIPTSWPREQTLWIYHQVDYDNHVTELMEFDNIVHASMTIILGSVASCGQ